MRWFRDVALASSLALVAIGYAIVIFKPFRFPDLRSPFRDVGDYGDLMREANEEISRSQNPLKAIGVQNWTLAGRVLYYNLTYASEVKVIDDRFDQFDLWNPKSYVGGDILFLVNEFVGRSPGTERCRELQPVKAVDLRFGGGVADRYTLVWCKGYGG